MLKEKNIRTHKKDTGAIFIPLLIWGGIAAAGALSVWWFGTSAIKGAALDVLTALTTWISYVLLYIAKFLCSISAEMFDKSLTMLDKTITKDPTFTSGWSVVRDFSNMFIVLGFVVVGIATALRVREWEAKKLLWPLVIVALLINFSGLFCGLIIDASNITSNSLIQSAGVKGGPAGSGMGSAYFKMIDTFAENTMKNAPPGNDQEANLKFLAAMIQITFIYLVVGATFLYMAVLFLARYGVLAFLYILSPLAFTCKIFPISASQKIWNDWWQGFLKWAFIAVGGCFALWIASNMMQSMLVAQSLEVSSLMVVLIFLVVGFKITTRSSGAMAGAVIGMATGAAGFAMGVAGKVTGRLAGATGLSRLGNTMKTGAIKAGEKMGLVAPGTAASSEAKRLEEPKKRLASLKSSQLAKIATQGTVTKKQSEDRAAAATILAERKDLDEIKDEKQRIAAVAHATSFPGVKRSDFEKADYRLADSDPKKVEKMRIARGFAKSAAGTAAAQRVVRHEQLEQNLPSMSAEQRRNIDTTDITDNLILSDKFNSGIVRDFRTASLPHRARLRALAAAGGALATAITAAHAAGNNAEENKLLSIRTEINRLP